MGLNEILSGRRSIRRYKAGTEVDPALIREMLEAAVWAPSWKNSQTSRYRGNAGKGKGFLPSGVQPEKL